MLFRSIVFPFVGEMVAYFQRHYDKCPMRTSILSGKDHMAEERDGNPTNCHDMFCMTLDLFYHLVDELKQHGYLKDGKGRVDMQEAVAIFLYIVGHNTWMRPVGDRFQHSTETVSRKFRRVLRAVHSYDQHLIKPDLNAVSLPEHMRSNKKYYLWFEVNHFIIQVLSMKMFAHKSILYSFIHIQRCCLQIIGSLQCREK